METLTLKSLRFRAFHGYYEKERREGNDFEIDLTFTGDFRKAGNSDSLDGTIDYQKVAEAVKQVMDGPSVQLIETLAERIGSRLFEAFPATQQLEVWVRKMHPPLDIETAYSEINMVWQR